MIQGVRKKTQKSPLIEFLVAIAITNSIKGDTFFRHPV